MSDTSGTSRETCSGLRLAKLRSMLHLHIHPLLQASLDFVLASLVRWLANESSFNSQQHGSAVKFLAMLTLQGAPGGSCGCRESQLVGHPARHVVLLFLARVSAQAAALPSTLNCCSRPLDSRLRHTFQKRRLSLICDDYDYGEYTTRYILSQVLGAQVGHADHASLQRNGRESRHSVALRGRNAASKDIFLVSQNASECMDLRGFVRRLGALHSEPASISSAQTQTPCPGQLRGRCWHDAGQTPGHLELPMMK